MHKNFIRNTIKVLIPLLIVSGFFIARSREENWVTINSFSIVVHNTAAMLFIVASIIHSRVERKREKN
jgi:cytochrome b subunit of formate dehydrogenase